MNKILVIGIILVMTTAVFAAATFSTNSPSSRSNGSDGLVSYWAFDEGNGSTAYDSEGDNDGDVIMASWTDGISDDAIKFDGYNSKVVVQTNVSLNITDKITIEAWVNITGNLSGFASPVIQKGSNYYLYIFPDRFRFGTSRGSVDFMTTPALNKWTFLAATYDGSYMRLFVNGEEKASKIVTGPLATNSDILEIGRYSGVYFYGKIDEVALYNKALPTLDIKDHYENGTIVKDGGDGGTNGTGNHTCQEAMDAIDALIQKVKSYNLSKGTENSFVKKLENAKKSLGKENHNATLGKLGAFINHAEAQSGKKLTVEQADEMIADAEAIIEMINNCSG